MLNQLVSICCMTYNHENFIRQCLEGFVSQKTTFHFEILVHEDASKDNTADIVKEFELKYPNLFRCVYQIENQFKIKNSLFNILFPMAKGKYIALCEGDDYWTDPYKLQKQVDFLETNKEYSICFHEASVINKENGFLRKFNNINEDKDFYFIDLTQGNFISTASVVFRSNTIEKIPEYFFQLHAGDWGLHLLNAQNGKIRYLKDCMSVYRQHRGGIWATLSNTEMILKGVELMKQLDKLFDYKYHEHFKIGIEKRLENLTKEDKPLKKTLLKTITHKIPLLTKIKRTIFG